MKTCKNKNVLRRLKKTKMKGGKKKEKKNIKWI